MAAGGGGGDGKASEVAMEGGFEDGGLARLRVIVDPFHHCKKIYILEFDQINPADTWWRLITTLPVQSVLS